MSSPNESFCPSSHPVEYLAERAIAGIEQESQSWTNIQEDAHNYLKRFFDDDQSFIDLLERLRLAESSEEGSHLVGKIGDLFGIGDMKDVELSFKQDEELSKTGSGGKTTSTWLADRWVSNAICIAADHYLLRDPDVNVRRRRFFSLLFHEVIHAFFAKYGLRSSLNLPGTGHHVGWSSVANAMERRAQALFGTRFNLSRVDAFVCEVQSTGKIDLTDAQLFQFFDGEFLSRRDYKTSFVIGVILGHGSNGNGCDRAWMEILTDGYHFLFINRL